MEKTARTLPYESPDHGRQRDRPPTARGALGLPVTQTHACHGRWGKPAVAPSRRTRSGAVLRNATYLTLEGQRMLQTRQ